MMTSRFVSRSILTFLVVIGYMNVNCVPPPEDKPVNIIPSNSYPNPKRDKCSVNTGGNNVQINDPYTWMENVNSTETNKFIEEEMAITKPYLEKVSFRAELTTRYKELSNLPTITRFAQHGNKFFSYESNGSPTQKQNVIYVHDSPKDEGKVFLDPNTFSKDNTILLDDPVDVGSGFSHEGLIMAYSTTDTNSDFKTIQFKHVEKADMYKEKLTNVKYCWISWSKDNKGIFYSAYPQQKGEDDGSGNKIYKNHKLYYHYLGTEQANDIVVVEFPENPDYLIGGLVTDTGNYLLVTVILMNKGSDKTAIYIADLNKVNCQIKGKLELIPVVTKMENSYAYVTNIDTVFIFKTNQDADNYKIISIDIKNPNQPAWKDLVPVNEKNVLSWTASAYEKYMILTYFEDVKTVLQVHEIATGKMVKRIPIDIGIVGYYGFCSDIRYKDIYFRFESPLSPGIIYHCDLSNPSFNLEVIKEIKLKNFDREKYIVEQVFTKSKDGTQLPMFLTYKKGLQKNGNNFVFMTANGAFSTIRMPDFTVNVIAIINNFDGIYVAPTIRGGGDYDDEWHRNGSLDKKQNTFDDFQAVAEFLITEKYTNSKLLAVNGPAGGGLLMGVCINQRPDLFGAVTADRGFYDMLRFDKLNNDTELVEEFGTPSKPEDFAYLIKYSPLHNIEMTTDKQYPPTMISTPDPDKNISPAHSLKFIAELQFQAKSHPNQQNPLILRVAKNDGSTDDDVILNNFIANLVDMMSFIALSIGINYHA